MPDQLDDFLSGKLKKDTRGDSIRRGASQLGIDPIDYATAMSYETGDTFDPWQAGPTTKWGQHRGTIQYGEPQRKEFGVYQGQTFEDQVENSNVKYLKAKGVKPGMTLSQIYKAINAGDVNASDDISDGYGTIKTHVEKMVRENRPKVVERWFSQDLDNFLGGNSSANNKTAQLDSFLKQPVSENISAPIDGDTSSPTSTRPRVVPVPESDFTIESQAKSALDAKSPRAAVLLTSPTDKNVPILADKNFTRVVTPNGSLFVNKRKAAALGLTTPDLINAYVKQNGFAKLIGKVEDVGNNTADGMAVRTETGDGKELTTSVVTNPVTAKAQIENDQKEFPGSKQTVIPAKATIQKRKSEQIAGLVEQGNIDLSNRPRVKNADGSISTVRSMSFEEDGKEILIPTVSDDGKILSDADAIALYRQTGKHLGKFADVQSANAYAQELHKQQEKMLTGDIPIPATQQKELLSAEPAIGNEEYEVPVVDGKTLDTISTNNLRINKEVGPLDTAIKAVHQLMNQELYDVSEDDVKEAFQRGAPLTWGGKSVWDVDWDKYVDSHAGISGYDVTPQLIKNVLDIKKQRLRSDEDQQRFKERVTKENLKGADIYRAMYTSGLIDENKLADFEKKEVDARKSMFDYFYDLEKDKTVSEEVTADNLGNKRQVARNRTEGEATEAANKKVDDFLSSNGYDSALEAVEGEERKKSEYPFRPLSPAIDAAKGFYSRFITGIPNVVLKTAASAIEKNPVVALGDYLTGGKVSEQTKILRGAADYWKQAVDNNEFLKANPDLQGSGMREVGEAFAQLAEQAILAPISGGASLALPLLEGGVTQDEAAKKAGAGYFSRVGATVIGTAAAVPEVLLKLKYVRFLLKSESAMANFANRLFGGLADKVGKEEAKVLTQNFLTGMLKTASKTVKTAATNYFIEKYQERTEDMVNDAYAKYIYKPEITWSQIKNRSPKEELGYEAAGIMGLFGGGAEVVTEKLSEEKLYEYNDSLPQLLADNRITEAQKTQAEGAIRAELGKRLKFQSSEGAVYKKKPKIPDETIAEMTAPQVEETEPLVTLDPVSEIYQKPKVSDYLKNPKKALEQRKVAVDAKKNTISFNQQYDNEGELISEEKFVVPQELRPLNDEFAELQRKSDELLDKIYDGVQYDDNGEMSADSRQLVDSRQDLRDGLRKVEQQTQQKADELYNALKEYGVEPIFKGKIPTDAVRREDLDVKPDEAKPDGDIPKQVIPNAVFGLATEKALKESGVTEDQLNTFTLTKAREFLGEEKALELGFTPKAEEAKPKTAKPFSERLEEAPKKEVVTEKPAEKEQAHDFSSTQVDLPKEVSAKMLETGKKLIPDSELYIDPKDPSYGREESPHITVKYGLDTANAGEVRKLLANEKPFEATLGKVSIFPGKEDTNYDVVKVDVESPDLHRLNKLIAENTKVTDTFPTYTPHATLAYVRKGEGQKYVGNADLEGQKMTFNSITFSSKNGEMVEIPLGSAEKQPKSEQKDDGKLAKEIFDRLDDTNDTFGDIVDEFENRADEFKRSGAVADAVDNYRKEQEEDDKLSGRNDMDAAEEAFTRAIDDLSGTPLAKHDEAAKSARKTVPEQTEPRTISEKLRKSIFGDRGKSLKMVSSDLLAPNGKPSNLSPQLYATVRTEEFKKWFGDWENDPENASKIVDKNGEPMVVYHGTRMSDIEEFDKDLGSAVSEGFFFTDAPEIASIYARNERGSNILPVFLSLRNAYVKDFQGERSHDFDDERAEANEQSADGMILRNVVDITYNEKFDSGTPETQYVVFEPTQIKSIFNEGTFDPANPSILKKLSDTRTEAEKNKQSELRDLESRAELIPQIESEIGKSGVLEVNLEAGEILRNIRGEVEGLEDAPDLYGEFLPPEQTKKYVAALKEISEIAKEAGIDTKAIEALYKNFQQVGKENQGTVAIALFKKAVPHEKGHQIDYVEAIPEAKVLVNRVGDADGKGDVDSFLATKSVDGDSVIQSIIDKTFKQFFSKHDYSLDNKAERAIVVQETWNYIQTNDYDALGLSAEEAATFAYHYFKNYVAKNGEQVINSFEAFYKEFELNQEHLEKVKNEINKKASEIDEEKSQAKAHADRIGGSPAGEKSDSEADENVRGEPAPDGNLKTRQYAETLRENGRNAYQNDVSYLPESEKAWSDNARNIIEESFNADPQNPFAQAIKEFNNKNQPESFRQVLGVALIDHLGAAGDYAAMNEVADKTVTITGTAAQVLRASQMVSKYDFAKGVQIAANGMKKLGKELTVPQIEEIKQKTGRYAAAAENESMTASMLEEVKSELDQAEAELDELRTSYEQLERSEQSGRIALEEAKKQGTIAKRLATFYKNKPGKGSTYRPRAVGSTVLRKELETNKEDDLALLRSMFGEATLKMIALPSTEDEAGSVTRLFNQSQASLKSNSQWVQIDNIADTQFLKEKGVKFYRDQKEWGGAVPYSDKYAFPFLKSFSEKNITKAVNRDLYDGSPVLVKRKDLDSVLGSEDEYKSLNAGQTPYELSPIEQEALSQSLKMVAPVDEKLLTEDEQNALIRQTQRNIVAAAPMSYDDVIKDLANITQGKVSESTLKSIHAEAVKGIAKEKLDVGEMTESEREAYETARANRKIRANHRRRAKAFEDGTDTNTTLTPLNRKIIKKIADGTADEKEKLITATILLASVPGAKAWRAGFTEAYGLTPAENDQWFKRAFENRAELKKEINLEMIQRRAEKQNWEGTTEEFQNQLLDAQRAKRDAAKSLNAHYHELQKATWEKIINGILFPFDLMRTAMSTGEVSQIGRQGYPTLLTFPKAWAKSLKGLQTGLGSPTKRFAYIKAIEETTRFKESVKYGMPYANFGESSVGDEHFPIDRVFTKLADKDYKLVNKVPGLAPVLSKAAKAQQKFEHMYTDPADLQRYLVYSTFADIIDGQGLSDKQTEKAKKAAVYYAQILSGKGSLPKFFGERSPATRILASVGFAPNLLASRIETAFHFNPILAPVFAPTGLKGTMFKKSLGVYAIPMLLALALGAIFRPADDDDKDARWYDVVNPLSKRFLRVTIRGTDINLDVSSGMSEFQRIMFHDWAYLLYKGLTGEKGEFVDTAQSLAQNEENQFLSKRYLRSKLSPGASLITDVAVGSDYLGHPINWKEGGYWGAITSRSAPLTWQHIYDSFFYDENYSLLKEPQTFNEGLKKFSRFKSANIPGALLLGTLEGVGLSANQYEKPGNSVAEDVAWSMWTNKYEAKDPQLSRVRTELRNLFKKKLRRQEAGKDTADIDKVIEEIKTKYAALPKKKLDEALGQAKQGDFEFVTKDFDKTQIEQIMRVATESEKKELQKILDKKSGKKPEPTEEQKKIVEDGFAPKPQNLK